MLGWQNTIIRMEIIMLTSIMITLMDIPIVKNMFWAFIINAVFTVIEFIGGIMFNSTAILADAVHDLGDSIALGFYYSY